MVEKPKKKVKKKGKKKKSKIKENEEIQKLEKEELQKIEDEKFKNKPKSKIISLNDLEKEEADLEEKLKVLDYDSDNDDDKDKDNKEKDTKQKESQKYSDIKEDDDIIMCSFNLPFEPVKQNDSFTLKLTNSPLYHILYKVIEKEKNIKWFGSLNDESIYTPEEREESSNL